MKIIATFQICFTVQVTYTYWFTVFLILHCVPLLYTAPATFTGVDKLK